MPTPKFPVFERHGNSRELVILLHGYTHSHRNLHSLQKVIRKLMPDADIFAPDMPFGFSSCAPQSKIISGLLLEIDRMWADRTKHEQSYESIVLIGHSLGALIARKLYICACGENDEAPFDSSIDAKLVRPWAVTIERIILLAGMNRGWSVNHHLSLFGAIRWTIGVFFGKVVKLIKRSEPVIFTIQRGSIFLTELRIQWLLMRRQSATKGVGQALTIQMLGSIDDMVSPADNIDLISGRDFIYLDVPYSGHVNIIDMNDSAKGNGRAAVFEKALIASPAVLKEEQALPSDSPAGEPKEDVTDVIFVIHGIRDEGYWTHKIARRIRARGTTYGRVVATKTSSYGYFPILRFVMPGERNRKVQWFMDEYVDAFAMYPNAAFSFVGHSNGTYLLASALSKYRSCRFRNVVFAGSVVQRNYNWKDPIESGQVKKVANYVATADWVVAFFPKAIQMLGLQDLGSAGHDGFESEEVSEVRYMRGAHGAAIKEDNWNAIANFILIGEDADKAEQLIKPYQASIVRIPAAVAPLIPIVILCVLVLIGIFILSTHICWDWSEWKTTLLFVVYLYVIWTVLTKL